MRPPLAGLEERAEAWQLNFIRRSPAFRVPLVESGESLVSGVGQLCWLKGPSPALSWPQSQGSPRASQRADDPSSGPCGVPSKSMPDQGENSNSSSKILESPRKGYSPV